MCMCCAHVHLIVSRSQSYGISAADLSSNVVLYLCVFYFLDVVLICLCNVCACCVHLLSLIRQCERGVVMRLFSDIKSLCLRMLGAFVYIVAACAQCHAPFPRRSVAMAAHAASAFLSISVFLFFCDAAAICSSCAVLSSRSTPA